jgi:putative peptide zinc metalloprotease protein
VDAKQPSGTRVNENVFLLDLTLREYVKSGHYGELAYVKFQHPAQPLAVQWFRAFKLLFIHHFS